MTRTPQEYQRGRGRPRDPELDERVLRAALQVYAVHGWSGFNFDAVSRLAGCGRPALYRRWTSKKELLLAALRRADTTFEVPDVGSIRDQLVRLAHQMLRGYLGPAGIPMIRMIMDGAGEPELWSEWETIRASRIASADAIVTRGIARGEITAGTSPAHLFAALSGGMVSLATSVPATERKELLATSHRAAAEYVDFVLFEAPGMTPSHHRVTARSR